MGKSRSTKKPGINIDMTPLVDVIMLLLTFFMLTATFKAAESEVEVSLPKSVNTDSTKLPDQDIMTLTLTPEGDIWIDVDSYDVRKEVFGDPFAIGLFHPDSTSKSEYELTGKVGDKQFKRQVVLLDREGFEKIINDLRISLKNMSDNQRDYKIVIKGDQQTNYGVVEDLMESLKETKNTRFALVTDLKPADE
jgi:biopolymer transport protein ExbD